MLATMNKKDITTTGRQEKILTGTVVSTGMKDTVVVSVSRYRKHFKYGKYLVRSKRLKAHDKGNTCVLGDIVFIRETRPISKDKHFIVVGKKSSAVVADEINTDSV